MTPLLPSYRGFLGASGLLRSRGSGGNFGISCGCAGRPSGPSEPDQAIATPSPSRGCGRGPPAQGPLEGMGLASRSERPSRLPTGDTEAPSGVASLLEYRRWGRRDWHLETAHARPQTVGLVGVMCINPIEVRA